MSRNSDVSPAGGGDALLLQLWQSYEETSFLLDAAETGPAIPLQEAARIVARREVARVLIRDTAPDSLVGLAIKLRMLGRNGCRRAAHGGRAKACWPP